MLISGRTECQVVLVEPSQICNITTSPVDWYPRQIERDNGPDERFGVTPTRLTPPKGGGAIRGIGEKFVANPVTGTGSMSVPIAVSSGRSGFSPQLSLSYDSGVGNGLLALDGTRPLHTLLAKRINRYRGVRMPSNPMNLNDYLRERFR